MLDAWNVLYDAAAPAFSLIVMTFGLAVLAAIGIAVAERVVTNRARRSTDSARRPLAPRTIMAGNRGEYAGPVTITVLVPAHDEQASVGATLVSLFEQSRPPERVLVVADNCSDDTARIARRQERPETAAYLPVDEISGSSPSWSPAPMPYDSTTRRRGSAGDDGLRIDPSPATQPCDMLSLGFRASLDGASRHRYRAVVRDCRGP